MDIQTTLRGGTLPALVEMLKAQDDVKYDVVVPQSRLSFRDGLLVVEGGAMRLDDEGFSECDAVLVPTDRFDGSISNRLGIPRQYMRTLRGSPDDGLPRVAIVPDIGLTPLSVPLIDANVNGWLQADPDRKVLVRGFRTDDPDEHGIARAFLSNSFGAIDHYDMLLSVLEGCRDAGVDTKGLDVQGDLSERNMRVTIAAPQITALAPVLLQNYRSPFGGGIERVRDLAAREGMGYEPGTEPVVEAGLAISNSETGGGAWQIMPRLRIQICRNGLTVTAKAFRAVHLGRRLEEGIVNWSDDTQHKNLELIKAQTRDAVQTFLNAEYLAATIAEIEQKADAPVSDAAGTIERVVRKHQFTEDEAKSILDCFIASGDLTAGGVMQAVTATAQRVEDPDRASDLEDAALEVLDTVAALA